MTTATNDEHEGKAPPSPAAPKAPQASPRGAWLDPLSLHVATRYALVAGLALMLVALGLALASLWTAQLARAIGGAAALALALALAWGLAEGNLVSRRLRRLTEATRRIARQDFSVAVPAQGQGEAAMLSMAINQMAQQLAATVSVHQVVAEMDEAILNKLDVRSLVRGALRCMRLVTHAEIAILGLFDGEDASRLHLFSIRKGSRNSINIQRAKAHPERLRRIPPVPGGDTSGDSPLPREYEEQVRRECGVSQFLVLAVNEESRAWGFMVTGHAAPQQFSPDQVAMLGGVAARLVAGFGGAERDRKLQALAYVDPLTGLPNRAALQPLLAAELANAREAGTKVAVLLIDLDRFKATNDSQGTSVADRLLAQAANRLRNAVREDDVVARSGGDQFTVALNGIASPRDAASVTHKLIGSLSRRFEIDGNAVFTGASVGIAIFPDDAGDGAELLKMADSAMTRAKEAGRNRFMFFEEPMNTESERRATLDGELRQALMRGEFVLHYQPQIDLHTGALFAVEALIRWQHPTRGLLYPKDFIEFADEIGLLPEISNWALAAACRQHRQWRSEGARAPRVAVNISKGQLPRSGFVDGLRKTLVETQMPPDALEIEVTESVLTEGGKAAGEAIEALASFGVCVSIDDFGMGYSSFHHLQELPARVLKLDMSFLVGAEGENGAGKIVAAIVHMAHALRKEVVAEGVENVQQLKLLKQLGCERGQGYLFGKPVPADQIQRIFRAGAVAGPAGAEPDAAAAGSERGGAFDPDRAPDPGSDGGFPALAQAHAD